MIVEAVVGRVVRVSNGEKILEFQVAKRPMVLINDVKAGLADLQRGDEVEFQNGSSNHGYKRVVAIREGSAVAGRRDLTQPVEV